MDHLEDISVEELRDALDDVDRIRPTQRFLAAIADKTGVTQTELVECHDTARMTLSNWLVRADTDEPLAQAAFDSH